jgi:cystathionine beta-lyase
MDFDRVIDRRGTCAEKWERINRDGGAEEVIPLWVADMDFPAPPELAGALRERADHPVYGYTTLSRDFFETLADWYRTQYRLDLNQDSFISGPGTVASLGIAIRALTENGDGVLLFTPVYKPFSDMIRANGRKEVEVPLVLNGGRYEIDFEALERTLATAKGEGRRIPLALFCSPHNPGGTVWERGELEKFLALARQFGVTVVSDEIHGDFVYPPKRFVSMAALPEYACRAAVVSSATKSFNLGGLRMSHFVTGDGKLAAALKAGVRAWGYDLNIFSMIAAETAYRSCGPWLEALKPYIRDTIDEGVRAVNAGIPGVRAYKPEGTYLIWADASALIAAAGLRDDLELASRLEREGRVKVTPGSAFGPRGRGFLRLNAACPRSQFMEGINRFLRWAASTTRL